MARETSIADLQAEADHAALRLALYRRRVYLGRADPAGLRERERVAHGAAERLRRARESAPEPSGE
jgi:hypothetical protein